MMSHCQEHAAAVVTTMEATPADTKSNLQPKRFHAGLFTLMQELDRMAKGSSASVNEALDMACRHLVHASYLVNEAERRSKVAPDVPVGTNWGQALLKETAHG